jgi:hypothetical protein
MSDWIEISMKFDSKCKLCDGKMSEGDRGLWLKGTGVKHLECPESKEPVEEEKTSYELFDETIYPYQTASDLKYCQFCGKTIDSTIGDKYINKDMKSCSKCFRL